MPKTSVETKERKLLYKEKFAEFCEGANAITDDRAKDLLGWEIEPKGSDWGDRYLFKDRYGNKVRCHNNIRNRDIDKIKVSELVQEILRGHWVMNCESLIIGVTGIVLNGQHTLIAL